MIEVKHLVKEFKSKKKEIVRALDDVSFTLEDKGFVFIVGKSGSGKTTLLSLLGTLDSITSGDIIVDGISLKDINEKNASYYRNERIGFVYQDYRLINELTISENIKLALNLIDINDDELIKKALSNVGLEGYESRFPKELSGGEKQRIAIARAIVKNPDIILADEPTGNLDSNTTKSILELLASFAKDKLVIIVSHDLNSAYNYATKIIKLENGKVIDTLIRNKNNKNELEIKDDTLFIPFNKKLSEEQEQYINSNLANIKHFKQTDNEFIKDTSVISEEVSHKPLLKKHLKLKEKFKLGFTFLKSKLMPLCIFGVLITCLLNVLTLTEIFSSFDKEKSVQEQLKAAGVNDLVIKKDNQINDSSIEIPISEEEVNAFKELPLKGKVYERIWSGFVVHNINPHDLYRNVPNYNLLVCDEDLLISKYGNNGALEYLAKNKDPKPYGVYVSDFFADAWIKRYTKYYDDYDSLLTDLGRVTHGFSHFYVNGIFKTNYQEKYKDILAHYTSDGILIKEEAPLILGTEEFIRFMDELDYYLATVYSFNPNFRHAIIDADYRDWCVPQFSKLGLNDKEFSENIMYVSKGLGKKLENHDVIISNAAYYSLTGIKLESFTGTKNIEPLEAEIHISNTFEGGEGKINHNIKINIVGVFNSGASHYCYCSSSFLNELEEYQFLTKDLYFSDINDSQMVLKESAKLGFVNHSELADVFDKVADIVVSFNDIFNLIKIVLFIGIFLVTVVYALRTIKEQMENIGILKSLGLRNVDLGLIFSINSMMLFVLVIILFGITSSPFITLANNILIESIKAKNYFININTLIYYDIGTVLINDLIVFLIGVFACLCALIKLHKIKPINIIKAKE